MLRCRLQRGPAQTCRGTRKPIRPPRVFQSRRSRAEREIRLRYDASRHNLIALLPDLATAPEWVKPILMVALRG
jgi:hypothetical protein